ncbi:hypothetical protein [Streptomyces griseosporeus]
MDGQRLAYRMLAERAGRNLLTSLQALPEFHTPQPIGLLRVQVTLLDGGIDLGYVDKDPVNISGLADVTARRAEDLRAKHARPAKPALRVLRGGA